MNNNMKKSYSKKQLALLIIEANPDIFIPVEALVADLDSIYKIKKIGKKIILGIEYDESLLKNLIKISRNIFSDNVEMLYDIIISDEEMEVLLPYLKRS